MDTSSILPPHRGGGGSSNDFEEKAYKPFYEGEFVLMRSKRISKKEIKRFYDLYDKTLPLETWWSYLSKDYNKQIQFAKDSDDDGGYYMFHTKYIGKVKAENKEAELQKSLSSQTDLYSTPMILVEWEAREELFPGESLTRIQQHYAENLISMSKMTILTKEEILKDVLENSPNI